ncbi:MAG: hypothetical protein A3D92_20335 [Bacteroidetes bacterium RIFCSPHIGHO2_02_FULL_44_7]|nr:MAG: hypothetical protein A3D92_20335 [Bacteroidetes bacterium RIFCSPHIGHO2_02_FULL_44_7]
MDELKTSVLYLSYDGMTDPLGQSQVLPYLRGLAQKGYTIHLVSYEKQDRFQKHRNHIQKMCDDMKVIWHPQDYVVGGSIFTTIRQVRRMQKIAFYLQAKHQFSIVHCRSYISALAGLKLKRKLGTKFIFDMRGFWADERVDGGLWSLSNPLYRLIYKYFKRKELQFFKESDYTISLTKCGQDEIKSWAALKDSPIKIQVIPCCVDLDLFDPKAVSEAAKEALRTSLGISKSDYVLGYVGSIGTWYMLPEMLDYFRTLKNTLPNAKFLFVTSENAEKIQTLAIAMGLNRSDILVTSVLHYQVPACISIFDKSIFFIRPTYSKKASSPTKQGEIMAMGVPLICNAGIGDTSEIVESQNSGTVIKEFTESAYIAAINGEQIFDSTAISAGAKTIFSLEEGVKRYLKVYEHLH